MIYITEYFSPVGKIILKSDSENLIGLSFGELPEDSDIQANNDDLTVFILIKGWLDRYFRGENLPVNNLPLKLIGSSFRQLIWKYLLEIPYGTTVTYGELAQKAAIDLNKKLMSAQAVGNAVKNNPIAIIVPCHRVLSQKNIGGYNAGIERKIYLLKLEGVKF